MVDVARLAGVSAMTVSGVFRAPDDDYSVAEDTRQKVLKAAAKLGYRPNAMARATRSRQFRNIGFLVMKAPEYLWVMLSSLAGIYDGLNDRGYHLTFIGLPPDLSLGSGRLPTSFQEECIDALIVDSGVVASPQVRALLPDSRFPIVWLNHSADQNAIRFDDDTAGREATLQLLAKGYRKPAFFAYRLGDFDWHESFERRRQAFRKTVEAAGLKAREILVPHRPVPGHEMVAAALTGKDRPDSLVCYSDAEAIYLQRSLGKLGLRIPQDIAISTFQGDSYGLSNVDLSRVVIPWYAMGKAAADMAIELARDPRRKIRPSVQFSPSWHEGESL